MPTMRIWISLAAICGICLKVAQTRKLECTIEETRIYSYHAYDYTGRNCSELIAAPVDHYNPQFVSDCKRWMGADHPNSVSDYFVIACDKEPDGSLKYRAEVCCTGTTEMSCFECDGFESAGYCREHSSAFECDPGQVCQTTVRYVNYYPDTYKWKTTGCANATSCVRDSADNLDTCKDWLTDPECNYCCDTPHCNYYPPSGPDLYVGDSPCLSNPCENGATCESAAPPDIGYTCICTPAYTDPTCSTYVGDPCLDEPCAHGGICVSSGTVYDCKCPIGWTGHACETATPVCTEGDNFCQNGGTCYDHSPFGRRCNCTQYYLGANCELERVNCTSPMAYRVGGGIQTFTNTDCTTKLLADQENVANENGLYWCTVYMQQQGRPIFVNNWDGEVNEVESRSHHYCHTGDQYTFVQTSWCCPTCHSMPCLNEGWCTQQENGNYQCKCRAGWYGRNCEFRQNMCLISGDPHYTTFDGVVLHFQGGGDYELCTALNRLGETFSVTSSNEKIGYVSYLFSLTVSACDHVAVLGRDHHVTVDDRVIDPAAYLQFDCMKILMNGNQVRLETSYGLVVQYDGLHTGFVQVPVEFMNDIKGLCGNFDGKTENEYIARDGTDYKDAEDRQYQVGVGWEIGSSNDTNPDPTFDCDTIAGVINSTQYCGHLRDESGIFSSCLLDERILSQSDFENCQYDVCANYPDTAAMKSAACDSMEAYVVKCEEFSHVMIWRNKTNCPLQCKEGMYYSAAAPACPATCRVPDAPTTCELPDKEGCVCPSGTLLSGGSCIHPSDCGCIDDMGNHFEVGGTWLNAICDVQYSCLECTSCPLPVGEIIPHEYSCPEGTLCAVTTTGLGSCPIYTDPCLSDPCHNGGECESTGWDYFCKCRAGYFGQNCGRKRAECLEGLEYCQNGGTCFDHQSYGLRCRCPPEFVGTVCEFPVLTCSDPDAYRPGGSAFRKNQDCTDEINSMQSKLDDTNNLYHCKNWLQQKDGPLYEGGVHGHVTETESRSFSVCDKGDIYMFRTFSWCCPTCFSVPCLNGGFCTQVEGGDYHCECASGWSGRNCETAADTTTSS